MTVTARYLMPNQYSFHLGKAHFVCSLVRGWWELYASGEGYITVKRIRDGELALHKMMDWIAKEYGDATT